MSSIDYSPATMSTKGWDHKIPYREADHGSFEEEWPPHEGVLGWWYATGYLQDTSNPDQLYAYQYTQFNFPFLPETPNIRNPIYQLNLTFTDLQTGLSKIEGYDIVKLLVLLGFRRDRIVV